MFNPLDDVAHVIQTALTPAFMLAGLAAFLGVFSGRLDRVGDQIDQLTIHLIRDDTDAALHVQHCSRQLDRLRRRTMLLDIAMVLGAAGGGLICLAALLLFIGGFRNVTAPADVLLGAFGLALLLTTGAIAAFLAEMLLSSRSLRADVCVKQAQVDRAESTSVRSAMQPV